MADLLIKAAIIAKFISWSSLVHIPSQFYSHVCESRELYRAEKLTHLVYVHPKPFGSHRHEKNASLALGVAE